MSRGCSHCRKCVCDCRNGELLSIILCYDIDRQNLYNNITYMYPNATIWLVGHSVSYLICQVAKLTSSLEGPSHPSSVYHSVHQSSLLKRLVKGCPPLGCICLSRQACQPTNQVSLTSTIRPIRSLWERVPVLIQAAMPLDS